MDRGALERMLAAGTDNVMLRYALGSALLSESAAEGAVVHLRRAVELAPDHSASWKLLGKALTAAGDVEGAAAAYEQGIETAEAKKDVQAVKEMRVFLKRLRRQSEGG